MARGKPSEVPLEDFSRVVEAIYDCALDPGFWPDAIRMVGELLQGDGYALSVHNHEHDCTDLVIRLGAESDEQRRQYAETYARVNPLFAPMLMLPGAPWRRNPRPSRIRNCSKADSTRSGLGPRGCTMLSVSRSCKTSSVMATSSLTGLHQNLATEKRKYAC